MRNAVTSKPRRPWLVSRRVHGGTRTGTSGLLPALPMPKSSAELPREHDLLHERLAAACGNLGEVRLGIIAEVGIDAVLVEEPSSGVLLGSSTGRRGLQILRIEDRSESDSELVIERHVVALPQPRQSPDRLGHLSNICLAQLLRSHEMLLPASSGAGSEAQGSC